VLALVLLGAGVGAFGLAAYAVYTEVRYPRQALNAADVDGLHAVLVSGEVRVTGTIADSKLAIRKISSGRVGHSVWLRIYPEEVADNGGAKIDLRVRLRPGTSELRFGPDRQLIWRAPVR